MVFIAKNDSVQLLFQYYLRIIRIEPVGSVGPRLTSGDESRVVRISAKHSFTLLCPAQSYPVPAYR